MSRQKSLTKKGKKKILHILAREERQAKLKKLFSKCIGRKDAVTQLQIFKALYGDTSNYSDIQIFYLWAKIKLDMNWLRRTTKFFIASTRTPQGWVYFVVKTQSDADCYISNLKKTKKRIDYMMRRCQKAVDEGFYRDLE